MEVKTKDKSLMAAQSELQRAKLQSLVVFRLEGFRQDQYLSCLTKFILQQLLWSPTHLLLGEGSHPLAESFLI